MKDLIGELEDFASYSFRYWQPVEFFQVLSHLCIFLGLENYLSCSNLNLSNVAD